MIYKVFLILLLMSVLSFPQEKHFIYFKDKMIKQGEVLNKVDKHYQAAIKELSEKAIQRRIKNLGSDFIFYEDIPINKNYVEVLKSFGVEIVHELKWFNSVSARLTKDQLEQIKNLDFVEKIEPVKKIFFRKEFVDDLTLDKEASSADYGQSYTQLNLSDIPIVHSKGITGENVIIGLLDSGFDWERHISLQNQKVLAEYDFIFNDNVTADETEDQPGQHNHGTLIFSIIGGFHDSTMIGAAYNSSFLLAKTEDIRSETHIEEDNYAAALIWMEGLGVDITSSSLGYSTFDSPEESYTYADMDGKTTIVTKAAELAFLRGVSTFTSAGNEGNTSWYYITAPADGKNIIAVGAVSSTNQIASFSSRGPTSDGRIKPEVVAMGVSVFGAQGGTIDSYRFASGTSTSSPIATGVAALLLSEYPHLKNTQVRSIILESSANSQNPNNDIGYGLISAKNAIEFPNLELINNEFLLHKIFFKENIQNLSVVMNYSTDGINFNQIMPGFEGTFRYGFNFPSFAFGRNIQFYFTYKDSANNDIREPLNKNYQFNYGDLDISLNVAETNFNDYIVSDPFPNPFLPAEHKNVRINFKSAGNELFKMAIIDGSGQKVKEISKLSTIGNNFVEWDGFSNHGYLCASGVYYLLIQLGGKEYGKKMILLN